MKQPLLLLSFFLCITNNFSQSKRTAFFGSVYDDLGAISNVHIINLQTNSATNSNIDGDFKIFAKVNDTLKITHVGYKTLFVHLKAIDFGIKKKQLFLKKELIELEEITIKNHNLSGILESDIKQTPKNRRAELVQNLLDGLKGLRYENMGYGKDELHLRKPTSAIMMTDPIAKVAGVGGAISLGDDPSVALRAFKKKLNKTLTINSKLLKRFGKQFFYTQLKIPEEKYNLFIEYIIVKNDIHKLLKSTNPYDELKLIEILQKEAVSYLKIIQKE